MPGPSELLVIVAIVAVVLVATRARPLAPRELTVVMPAPVIDGDLAPVRGGLPVVRVVGLLAAAMLCGWFAMAWLAGS